MEGEWGVGAPHFKLVRHSGKKKEGRHLGGIRKMLLRVYIASQRDQYTLGKAAALKGKKEEDGAFPPTYPRGNLAMPEEYQHAKELF